MSGHDPSFVALERATASGSASSESSPASRRENQRYGTIIIIGGGCYGAYYLRQLHRAAHAGVLSWNRLLVVDRNPRCRIATEGAQDGEIVTRSWSDFLADYLAGAALDAQASAADAIVPSPLMPHLLFDWIAGRARARWPGRTIDIRGLDTPPRVPWQRAAPDGGTHYVSFAEWMCPINCIEPARCPVTRTTRDWTMPAALAEYVAEERARGHDLAGPFVFHCRHRAYGVGMIDVRDVIRADDDIARLAEGRTADIIVGTVSHCHGAIGRLCIAD